MPDSLCATEMIVSGAGSKVSDLQARGNTMFFEDVTEPGFMWVDVNGDSFTGVFIDADGNVDYERTFTRPD